MYDFSDISIITHVRFDTDERVKNFHIRKEFYNTTCNNLEYVYVEDDVSEKMLPHINGTEIYSFYKNDDETRKTLCYNIGSKMTSRPFLCFLDLDCIVHPEQILRACEYAKSEENIGIIYPFNGTALYLKQHAKETIEQTPTYETISQFTPNTIQTNFETDDVLVGNTQAPGGCFLCLSEQFESYNGFNPNFKGWGFEDNEFAARVHRLGHVVARVNRHTDVLWHLPHDGAGSSVKAENKHYINNRDICAAVESSNKQEIEEYIKTW